jgi:hypothetical protein
MAWLARLRFNVVRLDAAVHALLALPVLQRYALPATAFVVTAAMGKSVSWSDRPGLRGVRS